MPKNGNPRGVGGGIRSREVTKQPVQFGERGRAVSEKGVSQIGGSYGNHGTDTGKTLRGAIEPTHGQRLPGVKLGNEQATQGLGVGGGRNVHRTGSQQTHGPVAGQPAPQGRDILSSFGPESPNVKSRR